MRYDKLERIIENEGFYFEHKKEQKRGSGGPKATA